MESSGPSHLKTLRLGRRNYRYASDLKINHPLSHTDYMGTNCTVEQVCNATANDLIAIEFTTNSSGTFGGGECPVIWSSELNFWISPEQYNFLNDTYLYTKTDNFYDFETSTTYRSMTCIPNDECAEFNWEKRNSAVDYKIYQNGNELTERTNSTSYSDGGPRSFTTKTGVCAAGSTVGGGKRIGLVSVVATLLLAIILLV